MNFEFNFQYPLSLEEPQVHVMSGYPPLFGYLISPVSVWPPILLGVRKGPFAEPEEAG